jgi:hypothetical protein
MTTSERPERTPRPGFPNVSARALADLARAGYSAMRQPTRTVSFEVHHVIDRPGYLFDLVSAEEGDEFFETLCSAANGIGLVIRTRVGTPAKPPSVGQPSLCTEPVVDDWNRTVFRSTARPNIAFLHDLHHAFEGMILIEDEPRKYLFRHGLALLDALKTVGEQAAGMARAPILFLQCPAQPPTHNPLSDQGGPLGGEQDLVSRAEQPPRSSALGLRFAIALEDESAGPAFRLAEQLSAYCSARGLGLWLKDTRPGHRTGNWFLICRHDRQLARRSYPHTSDDGRPNNAVEGCLPVTFVGPARTGSTRAISTYLKEVVGVGVLACSATVLDDLAFIHLQLAVHDASRARLGEINHEISELRRRDISLEERLRALSPSIGPRGSLPLPHGQVVSRLVEKAGDYQVLMGRPFPIRTHSDARRHGIWISWQMHGAGADLAVPLDLLCRAIEAVGLRVASLPDAVEDTGATTIEYLVCRDVGSGSVRGKGKLAVPVGLVETLHAGRGSEPAIARLSTALEAAWKDHAKASSAPVVLSEITVSWREYWLGHWSSPF